VDEVFVAVCHDLGDGGEAAVVDDAVVVDVPFSISHSNSSMNSLPFHAVMR
jgi:hypothetical protein